MESADPLFPAVDGSKRMSESYRELRCSLAKLLDEDMCSVLEAKAASALKADVESQLQSIQALVDGIESLAADAVSARTSATELPALIVLSQEERGACIEAVQNSKPGPGTMSVNGAGSRHMEAALQSAKERICGRIRKLPASAGGARTMRTAVLGILEEEGARAWDQGIHGPALAGMCASASHSVEILKQPAFLRAVSRMLPSQKLDGWARALVAPEASAAKAKQATSEAQLAESAADVTADTPVVPIVQPRKRGKHRSVRRRVPKVGEVPSSPSVGGTALEEVAAAAAAAAAGVGSAYSGDDENVAGRAVAEAGHSVDDGVNEDFEA